MYSPTGKRYASRAEQIEDRSEAALLQSPAGSDQCLGRQNNAIFVAIDKLAVNVRALSPSVTLLALEVNVTVGALSLSETVIVCEVVVPVVTLPPETLLIEIVALSSEPSYRLSSIGVKEAVPVVVPAAIVIFETE